MNLVLFYFILNYLQDDIIKQFQEEIRKLKAIIVKHENRIRALEARLPAQLNEEDDGALSQQPLKTRTDNEQESELGPDEV